MLLLGSPEKDSFEDELIILDSDEGAESMGEVNGRSQWVESMGGVNGWSQWAESMGGSYSSDIDSDADGCGWIIPDEGVVIVDDTLQEYCVRPMM